MEQKRTYAEAVKITVDWWAEKSFKTKLNQNNGDNSGTGFLEHALSNLLSSDAQKGASDDKIDIFKTNLTNLLLQDEDGRLYHPSRRAQLMVDYNVNGELLDACNAAGISELCIPIKTFTFINPENEVEGRYQYGGDWFKL